MADTQAKKENEILYLTNSKIQYAKGMMTNEGSVILKDSKLKEGIFLSLSESLVKYCIRERNSKDIENGIFIKDHSCSSLSMAAVIILGRNSNGFIEWKIKTTFL